MALQDRIRFAREYVGFSQEQAAKALGWEVGRIREMEDGAAPGMRELKHLGALYRRPVAWLLGETPPVSVPARIAERLERLTPGDRDAVLDFMEFLRDAGEPNTPLRDRIKQAEEKPH